MLEVAPLPKSQAQAVGLPVDKSSKFTTIGAQPPVISDLKLAVGACALAYRHRIKQKAVRAAL